MGYYDWQSEKKKVIADAYRFCNERSRFQFALQAAIGATGAPNSDEIIEDVRQADFSSLLKLLQHVGPPPIRSNR